MELTSPNVSELATAKVGNREGGRYCDEDDEIYQKRPHDNLWLTLNTPHKSSDSSDCNDEGMIINERDHIKKSIDLLYISNRF